jgi:hypothetical protein
LSVFFRRGAVDKFFASRADFNIMWELSVL